MPQLLRINHETVYRYRRPVTFNEHRAIFRPRDSHDLRVIDARLTLSPPGRVRWMHEVFSNSIALISFDRESDELRFESRIEIKHYGLHEPSFPIRSYAATHPFRYHNDRVVDLLPTPQCHYPDPEGAVSAWARQFVEPGGVDTQELLVRITRAIEAQFAYRPRAILRWNDGTDARYELVDGRIASMAPPNDAHGTIVMNMGFEIRSRLRPPCRNATEAGILRPNRDDSYYIADLGVTCGPAADARQHLPEPILIVEVLSPPTEDHDRGRKVPDYREIPSLQEILVVASQERRVEFWRRKGDHWRVEDLIGEATVRLESCNASISLAAIYAHVDFTPDQQVSRLPP